MWIEGENEAKDNWHEAAKSPHNNSNNNNNDQIQEENGKQA